MTLAANTLLQSTVILQLAVVSYGRTSPDDPDLARWAAQARANLANARKIQLPGGAFSYIRNSGPDPCYFAFDSAFLGRYYQLTGDADARESLVRMAGWAGATTISGWLTPFSAPWWKHNVGSGGPYTGPETVTSLANDPVMRGVMVKRRGYIQPYTWSYVNMYGWTPADGPVRPTGDRCTFDRNANGPALRVGGWDVEMPARAWGDSCCGVSVATEKAITSCINAVYLTANHRNASPAKRSAQHAYAMLGEAAMKSGSSVVGDGWIAAVNSFDAHLGLYGDLPPDTSPWQRTDLWFADADGAVGALGLRCTRATTAVGRHSDMKTGQSYALALAACGFTARLLLLSDAEWNAGVNAHAPSVADRVPRCLLPCHRGNPRLPVFRDDADKEVLLYLVATNCRGRYSLPALGMKLGPITVSTIASAVARHAHLQHGNGVNSRLSVSMLSGLPPYPDLPCERLRAPRDGGWSSKGGPTAYSDRRRTASGRPTLRQAPRAEV